MKPGARKVLIAAAFLVGGPAFGAVLVSLVLCGMAVMRAGPEGLYALLLLPIAIFGAYFWFSLAALATGLVAVLTSDRLARDGIWIATAAFAGAVFSAFLRLEFIALLFRPNLDLGPAHEWQTMLTLAATGGVSAALIASLLRRVRRPGPRRRASETERAGGLTAPVD